MILTGLINAIYYIIFLVTTPIRILPNASLPEAFTSAILTANGYISSLNSIVPIDTILAIIALYVVIEGSYLTYKLTMWLIKRFPTQS